jgi:hypothetical protein
MTTLTMRPFLGEADLAPICDLLNYCDSIGRLDDRSSRDRLLARHTIKMRLP